MRRGWLTPDSLPSNLKRCVISFPDSDAWHALVRGALLLLADEDNFELHGSITVEQTADAFREALFRFLEDDCMDLPIATILPYAGGNVPQGYLLCNGQAVSRTTYSSLFLIIGDAYGPGNGTTTFNVPNLMSRFLAGFENDSVDFDPLGVTGGEIEHTLTVGEMPSHSHSTKTAFEVVVGGSPGDSLPAGSGGVMQQANQIGSSGGGSPHNNLPPYLAVNFIIKF